MVSDEGEGDNKIPMSNMPQVCKISIIHYTSTYLSHLTSKLIKDKFQDLILKSSRLKTCALFDIHRNESLVWVLPWFQSVNYTEVPWIHCAVHACLVYTYCTCMSCLLQQGESAGGKCTPPGTKASFMASVMSSNKVTPDQTGMSHTLPTLTYTQYKIVS